MPVVSASCCRRFGSVTSCIFLIAFACFCTFSIRFCIVRNSSISILRTGLGGISFSRMMACRNSFALPTIPRNRFGSQPFSRMDWLALSWISVCLISNILASSMPDTRAKSAVLFHSCLAVLSASISAALGLFLPIFFVGRYTLFLSNTFSRCSESEMWELISSV